MKKSVFDWTAWFWFICITSAIITGIYNFDTEQIVTCCLILLPVVLFDIILAIECISEVKYYINKYKKRRKNEKTQSSNIHKSID